MGVEKTRACQHLRCIGFPPKEASRIASLLDKWSSHSGKEWTVKRFKSLKQAFNQSLASGERLIVPEGWATRKNRRGETILRDRYLHEVLSYPRDAHHVRIIEGFLRIYQVLKLDKESVAQKDKFAKAVMLPASVDLKYERMVELLPSMRFIKAYVSVIANNAAMNCDSLPDFLGGEKRSPSLALTEHGFTMSSFSRSDKKSASFIDYINTDVEINNLWFEYPKMFANRLLGEKLEDHSGTLVSGRSNVLHHSRSSNRRFLPAGSVSCLQEPGCKARWVANPLLLLQALGEPLKVKLQCVAKEVYGDVVKVHSQDEGHQMVIDWLTDGRTVWSYDLTSFTDRFPLLIQLRALELLQGYNIVSQFDVDTMKIVAAKTWTAHPLARGAYVKWEIGQPLGFGPSFPLAAITHGMLLDSLATKLGVEPLFCVVGDDVVIADEKLSTAYVSTLAELGVDVNKEKSMISNKYAEFLGKILTSEGVNPSIKVKLIRGEDQLVDALAFYGKSAIRHLHPREKKMAAKAFLPTNLGGLGWRIDGIRYGDFLKLTDQDAWGKRLIRKDLQEFFGDIQTSLEITRGIQLRTEFFAANAQFPPMLFGELKGNFVKSKLLINELTDIPVDCSLQTVESINQDALRKSTFVEIVDSAIRIDRRYGDPIVRSADILLEDGYEGLKTFDNQTSATSILSKEGYVNSREKPFSNGQSLPTAKDPNERSSDETRSTKSGIFQDQCEGAICASTEEIQQLIKRFEESAESRKNSSYPRPKG